MRPSISAATTPISPNASSPGRKFCGPGRATIGAALIDDKDISGVATTATKHAINQRLAARPGAIVPFIAETGGLDGIFDTAALRDQTVDDVI